MDAGMSELTDRLQDGAEIRFYTQFGSAALFNSDGEFVKEVPVETADFLELLKTGVIEQTAEHKGQYTDRGRFHLVYKIKEGRADAQLQE
jgi:hypothetical protein